MIENDNFFEWMGPSEFANDFEISQKEDLKKVQERGMRTQTTRHGEFQIFGQDLQTWYNELKATESQNPKSKIQNPKSSSSSSSESPSRKSKIQNRKPRPNPVHPSLLPNHDRIPSKRSQWGEKPIPIPIEEAAMMLGVSLRTINRMIRDCTFATRIVKGEKLPILQSIEFFQRIQQIKKDTQESARKRRQMVQSSNLPLEVPDGVGVEIENPKSKIENPEDSWVTTDFAAETLQITKARVCQLVWQGKLA